MLLFAIQILYSHRQCRDTQIVLILGQRENTVLFENLYYLKTDLVLNLYKIGYLFLAALLSNPYYSWTPFTYIEIRKKYSLPIILVHGITALQVRSPTES